MITTTTRASALGRAFAAVQALLLIVSLVAMSLPAQAFAQEASSTPEQTTTDTPSATTTETDLTFTTQETSDTETVPTDADIQTMEEGGGSDFETQHFTNLVPKLHVKKVVVGQDHPDYTQFGVTVTKNRIILSDQSVQKSFDTNGDITVAVDPTITIPFTNLHQSYNVVENNPGDNYTVTYSNCSNLTFNLGDDKTCTITNTYTPPTPKSCTISSDTKDYYVEGGHDAVATYVHPAWATIPGATWIWGDAKVQHPREGETQTFTKTFTVTGTPTSASIEGALDNGAVLTINGTTFPATDPNQNNYNPTHTGDITSVIHSGTNTMTVAVTNLPYDTDDYQTNPAGLIYKITINGADCTEQEHEAPPTDNGGGDTPTTATIVAAKVVCNDESYLPNWGDGSASDIDVNTAANFVAASKGACHFEPGWDFQWVKNSDSASNPGDNITTPAPAPWSSVFTTGTDGKATVTIPAGGMTWVREVLKDGYVPFTGANTDQNVSAEMYCSSDVLNYDNWDFISEAQPGHTYYCVAFNAPVKNTQCTPDAQETYLSGDMSGDDLATTVDSAPAEIVSAPHATWFVPGMQDGSWIWYETSTSDADAADGVTKAFTRTFSIVGTPKDSTLTLAADNGVEVSVNGHELVNDQDEHNYEATATYPVPAADLLSGANTITFTVTNQLLNGGHDGTPDNNPAGLSYKLVVNNDECEVPPPTENQTSTVTMCKAEFDPNLAEDNSFPTLPGWTLELKGASVGNVNVNPDGTDYTIPNVPAGNYIFTAAGSYIYRPNDVMASTSDAAYSLRLPSDSVYGGPYAPWVRENSFPTPYTGDLGVMFNHAFTDWGSIFNPNHVYALGTTTAATGNLAFNILDDVYSDNSGHINVAVDQGFAGVTGENGCVTFDNVPYGEYTVGEINKEGWSYHGLYGADNQQIEGLNVTIAHPTEKFTVLNENDANNQEPTTFKVHVRKFLDNGDGGENQIGNDDGISTLFPMHAQYDIAGLASSTNDGDPYNLGDGQGTLHDGNLLYSANTVDLHVGDSYGTHEVTTDLDENSPVVADEEQCSEGKYVLEGYKWGDTLEDAEDMELSTTAPFFANLTGQKYVIVVNKACGDDNDDGDGGTGNNTSTTVTVRLADLATDLTDAVANAGKWFFYNDKTDKLDNTLGSFVSGPDTAPLSAGSAQISATTTQGIILDTFGFKGTRLADITTLAYSTYRSAGDPALALALQFDIDNDTTDGDTGYKGRLVYEPYYTHTIANNTWQEWSPMDNSTLGGHGNWWFSNGTLATGSGCSQATPCTWSQILAAYPNAGISGGTDFKAGSNWATDFTGNVDKFVIGIKDGANTNTTTYDFEPDTVKPNDNGGTNNNDTTKRRLSGGGSNGKVLGATTECSPLITQYLGRGFINPSDEVVKLQGFLNQNLGISLPLTGIFGPQTTQAVKDFQTKFWETVLKPWFSFPDSGITGSDTATGIVYKTTKWEINNIVCPGSEAMPVLP
jgi:hypothetical protein